MFKLFLFGLMTTVVLTALAQPKPAQTPPNINITYDQLVARLYDPQLLAKLPEYNERTGLVSSYDRRAKFNGKFYNWGANNDKHQDLKKEGKDRVLADIRGPGCVTHLFATNLGPGKAKIYIDGKLIWDKTFADLFNNQQPPFNYPGLVYISGGGAHNFVPMPFLRSFKLVADSSWGESYQIRYIGWQSTVKVPLFSAVLTEEFTKPLSRANKILEENNGTNPRPRNPEETVVTKMSPLSANGSLTLLDVNGPAAITGLQLKFKFRSKLEERDLLRKMYLKIIWNDENTPAVWCPVGDFFGTSQGRQIYNSLLCGVKEDEFYSWWYMPFAKRAMVELYNESDRQTMVQYSLSYEPVKDADLFGSLHVKWQLEPPAHKDKNRWPDRVLLTTRGKGRLVGFVLNVWAPRQGPGNAATEEGSAWWGEGDDRYGLEGEQVPSLNGTGTDHLFGVDGLQYLPLIKPLHGLNNVPNNANNEGHYTLYRWFIPDFVSFTKGLDFTLEKYFPDNWPVQYDYTVFWYLGPNGTDPLEAIPVDRRLDYHKKYTPFKETSAIEFESLRPVDSIKAVITFAPSFEQMQWSGDKVLHIFPDPNKKVTFKVSVPSLWAYDLSIGFSKSKTSPIVQVYLDGKKVGKPIDLYSELLEPFVVPNILRQSLSAGEHTISFEIVGANPAASAQNGLMLDYVKFNPVK